MKNIIMILFLSGWTMYCVGQKTLNEVRMTSKLLEEVPRTNLSVVQASVDSKKKTAGLPATSKLVSNERTKIYHLKGGEDVVRMISLTHRESLNNWEKELGTFIEMYAPEEGGMERYVENIKGDDFEAVSFFTKSNFRGKDSYALYRNKGKGIALFIVYMTNASDNIRIANMRDIINDLKIE